MSSKDDIKKAVQEMPIDDLRAVMAIFKSFGEVAPKLLESIQKLPYKSIGDVWNKGAARERGKWNFNDMLKTIIGKHAIEDGKLKLKQQNGRETASMRQSFDIFGKIFEEVAEARKDEVSKVDIQKKIKAWMDSGVAEMPSEIKVLVAKSMIGDK